MKIIGRKIFVAVVIAGACATSTFARDPSPTYVHASERASHWTGFYVGGNVGGLWTSGNARWDPLPSPVAFTVNPIEDKLKGSSFAGGVHAGYNWQFSPIGVAGIEADWTGTKARDAFTQHWILFGTTTPSPFPTFTTMRATADWLASVRARLGILVAPNVLTYATGGGAWGRFDYAANNNNGALGSFSYITSTAFSSTSGGYVAGGGVEWSITSNWLLRSEYLFYRLNSSRSVIATSANFPGFPSRYVWGDTNISEARLGLSYKF